MKKNIKLKKLLIKRRIMAKFNILLNGKVILYLNHLGKTEAKLNCPEPLKEFKKYN